MRGSEDKYLMILGRASGKAMEAVKNGFTMPKPKDSLYVFLGFSYDDIPIDSKFNVLFQEKNLDVLFEGECIVRDVTQEFGKPLKQIPSGWRTIALLHFPDGIPKEILNLPEIDSWSLSKKSLRLTTLELYNKIKRKI